MEPTLTPRLAPYLVTNDAAGLGQFLEKALGGTVTYRVDSPDGGVVHMEVRIADGLVMIGESPPGRPLFPAMVHLYVPDPEGAHRTAVAAGATSVRAVEAAPDGSRRGGVRDRWGNEWWFTGLPK
ncbi:MAG TPA: VOC family protein [Thermoplasmata archaeon]|nr:VOC family protein [Thermoplasmata archaeon]